MAEVIPEDAGRFPSREKRVNSELRNLMTDPPEGLRATPLDTSYYHWQATIRCAHKYALTFVCIVYTLEKSLLDL